MRTPQDSETMSHQPMVLLRCGSWPATDPLTTHTLLSTDPNAGGTKWFKDSFSPPPTITGSSLSLLVSGTCTRKGKWCRLLGESSSDRGPVIGLRREPDRGGETQKPNGAGTPRTRPDETKDRQARQQAKGGREARRRESERTHTHIVARGIK